MNKQSEIDLEEYERLEKAVTLNIPSEVIISCIQSQYEELYEPLQILKHRIAYEKQRLMMMNPKKPNKDDTKDIAQVPYEDYYHQYIKCDREIEDKIEKILVGVF